PTAGGEGERGVDDAQDDLGRPHRDVVAVVRPGAPGERGDEVVVTGDGEPGSGEGRRRPGGGHLPQWCPGGDDGRQEAVVDAEVGEQLGPRGAGVLVDEAGAGDERTLPERLRPEGGGDELGQVGPATPREGEAAVAQVEHLGGGNLDAPGHPGAAAELLSQGG